MRLPASFARIDNGVLYAVVPLSILLCVSIGIWSRLGDGLDPAVVLTMTGIAVSGVAIHLFFSPQKNWLRLDTIFILGFLIVNFQWPLMYAVTNYVPIYSFQANSIERAGSVAVALATMSLLAWLIGYRIFPAKYFKPRLDIISGSQKIIGAFVLAIVGFAYFAGSSFFDRSIYTTASTDLYLTVSGIGSYFLIVVEIVAILALSYLLYQRLVMPRNGPRVRAGATISANAILVLLLFVYCAIFLIGGDRGQIVTILVGGALALAARVRAVRLWEFIALACAGFIAFSIIGVVRSSLDVSSIEFASRFGYWEISTNLAQSVVTLTQAVTIIDNRGDLFFGSLWLSQLIGLIPFTQGIFLSITGLSIFDISSAMHITRYTFGNNIHTGLGTSFVADLYMNFGVPGTVLLSAMYGAICMKMATWLRGDHGFLCYFTAIAFGSLILYISRSSMLFQLKPILWGIGILILLVTVRRVR